MKLRLSAVILAFLAAATVSTASAGDVPETPAKNLKPLDAVEIVAMPPQDNVLLLNKALAQQAVGAYRIGEPIAYTLTPADHGTWEDGPAGYKVWRVRLFSEAAMHLNLGFGKFFMPPGGALFVYTPDQKEVYGPFGTQYNAQGELWTPLLDGEEVVVEALIPTEYQEKFVLELKQVAHGFRALRRIEKSGSCNVDVVCSQGDGWREQIRSVGAYTIGGVDTCSGALVNNTSQDSRRLFLTANHCGLSTGNAASVVIYWNYQNSTCRTPGSAASGAAGDGLRNVFSSGTTFRAANTNADFALIEVNNPFPAAYQPYWSGWDRRDLAPATVVGIHHPGVEEKRISFSNTQTTITAYNSTTVSPTANHIRIITWSLGTTEGGSSGSPLYDAASQRIVGQLHGGTASCTSITSDWYGRVFSSWTGGGTSATRLSDWLDPTSSGLQFIEGRSASDIVQDGAPVIADTGAFGGNGDGDGAIERGETGIGLTMSVRNSGTSTITGVTGTLISLTPGVTVTQNTSSYPNLVASGTGSNSAAFVISVDSTVACGSNIVLQLSVGTGTGNAVINYTLATGPTCNILPRFVASTPVTVNDAAGNNNGVPEPGELVSVTLPVTNAEGAATAVSGTLTTGTGTTSIAQSSSAYPNMPALTGAGSNVSPFQVYIADNHPCGAPVSLSLAMTSAGGGNSVTYSLPTGTTSGTTNNITNFDGGTTLPAGWTTAILTGTPNNWGVRTTGATPNTSPNLVSYAPGNTAVADMTLVSPPITNPVELRFFHTYAFEGTTTRYDGGVLEVSTNGGSTWSDLGSLITQGGYNGTISTGFSSTIGGRQAWTGGTVGAMTEVRVNLSSFNAQTIRVRWRFGADTSVASTGWFIDTVNFITQGFTCAGNAPRAITITPSTMGPTNTTSMNVQIDFNKNVVNFNNASDLVLSHSGTSVSGLSITGGPRVYNVAMSGMGGDGTMTVAVNTASDVLDGLGAPLTSSPTAGPIALDYTAPILVGGAAVLEGPNPTGADSVSFLVPFSEAVAGLTPANVTVTGTLAGTVSVATARSTDYRVTVTLADPGANGTVGIQIGTGVTDIAGNGFAGYSSPLFTILQGSSVGDWQLH